MKYQEDMKWEYSCKLTVPICFTLSEEGKASSILN